MVLSRSGWEVLEEKKNVEKVVLPFAKSADKGLEKHWVNFIEGVRSKNANLLHCPIQDGAHVATLAQMGNIAYRSKQKLFWDLEKNQFTDRAINKKYLLNQYHNGYKLPIA